MKKFLYTTIAGACFGAVLGVLTLAGDAAAQLASADVSNSQQRVDTTSAIVVLKGDPLSIASQTRPPQGKKIDFNSATVKSYRAVLSAQRNAFRQWLNANAPAAKITGQFDIALNAVSVRLNGTTLAQLRQAPQVADVQFENLYYPTTDPVQDPDLGLIQALNAWATSTTPTDAGDGVKVAIIDTGIDITHPCFNDTGYPAQKQIGDKRFTNNKVIAAKAFNNRTPTVGFTPEAIQEHGTHVAGTVGCNLGTSASVDGVTIPYPISGVAPRVLLGNYNVFPGTIASARSEDIFDALEAAYEDGFDIANMSLGGGQRGVQDLESAAVDHLDQANMVVAVAAGNSGPGYLTVESPGSAARALTAGASTVPHYIGVPVMVNGSIYASIVGVFPVPTNDLTAPLAVVKTSGGGFSTGCDALAPGSLAGKIALISRGTCSFSTKIRNAQNAGAVAAVIVNNQVGDPIPMAEDGTPNQPTIPAVMVGLADRAALVADDGKSTTISGSLAYFQTANADIMASFSSWGPTPVAFRIKPDVVAPGVNVLSSIPTAFCGGNPCFAFFQGTSMATPHLAGSAAVVKWLHPDWSSAEVRSAIVNTADADVLRSYVNGAPNHDVNQVGAGRENLFSAVNAMVALDPVSVSFGAVPSGASQIKPFTVTITDLTGSGGNYTAAVTGGDSSVAYGVTPSTFSVGPGQSTTITVVMNAAKGAVGGGHQATLSLSSGGAEVAHAAIYTLIK